MARVLSIPRPLLTGQICDLNKCDVIHTIFFHGPCGCLGFLSLDARIDRYFSDLTQLEREHDDVCMNVRACGRAALSMTGQAAET